MTVSKKQPTDAEPSVGVLMAVCGSDEPDQFDEALQSLVNQTYRAIKIWLFVDGSVGNALEKVITRYFTAEAAGRVIRSEASVGLPAALNHLIDDAITEGSVEYLARMDADDISVPERIERQVDFLKRNPDISIVGTWCIEFCEPGVPLFYKKLPVDSVSASKFMLYRSPLAHPTVMFHRRVFVAGYRYNPRYRRMQDYELWARLLLAGYRIANVPDYLLWFRLAEDFYRRRAGWGRAWLEVRLRVKYGVRSRLLRPRHLLGLSAFLLLRVMPIQLKKMAYRRLR